MPHAYLLQCDSLRCLLLILRRTPRPEQPLPELAGTPSSCTHAHSHVITSLTTCMPPCTNAFLCTCCKAVQLVLVATDGHAQAVGLVPPPVTLKALSAAVDRDEAPGADEQGRGLLTTGVAARPGVRRGLRLGLRRVETHFRHLDCI